jgi:predicted AAA+ superfamily ATPase
MTALPAWREIAVPREDIQDGSFDESSFAADLGLAAAGEGRPEYRDARVFFEQTYLTENLAVVLEELLRRIDGDPAAAGVYRMQTEFGGGKTHTLLAAYHLLRSPTEVLETACGQELAQRGGRSSFPAAKVVVLDGAALLAGRPTELESGIQAHTLLGHLAYGLGGAAAYARVAEQDIALLGSSTTQLSELIRDFAPAVIVLDEALEYLVKALPVRTNEGDLATTTLTLIKELSTAVAGVDRVALLATLTSSRPESYSEEGEGGYSRPRETSNCGVRWRTPTPTTTLPNLPMGCRPRTAKLVIGSG